MYTYYSDKLSADRLKRAYGIAPARVRRYLEAEISHVLEKIRPGEMVLELGCGYGRVLGRLASRAGLAVGIDTSPASLILAREALSSRTNATLSCMNAIDLAFGGDTFDCVVCIQNGISAFHVDKSDLIAESVRVTKRGGMVLFSTYAEKFWDARLEWFRLQSEAGLVGRIDEAKTRRGLIVCEDGFTATTIRESDFRALTSGLKADTRIVEVDESSLFCEIIPA